MTDAGPWNEYELVDSCEPGAKVGVKRKNDPHARLIMPKYVLSLENPNVIGNGVMGSRGGGLV